MRTKEKKEGGKVAQLRAMREENAEHGRRALGSGVRDFSGRRAGEIITAASLERADVEPEREVKIPKILSKNDAYYVLRAAARRKKDGETLEQILKRMGEE